LSATEVAVSSTRVGLAATEIDSSSDIALPKFFPAENMPVFRQHDDQAWSRVHT